MVVVLSVFLLMWSGSGSGSGSGILSNIYKALNTPSYEQRQAQLESQVPEGCQRVYEFDGNGRRFLTGFKCPY